MTIVRDKQKIRTLLTRGVEEIFIETDLEKKLLTSKKPLRVKLGFDPTGPNIHIGRAIVLRKLRDFQRLGHKIVFIVGDFTALIGDSSDKLGKRPMLTPGQIRQNLKKYKAQVGKIIDLKKAEFRFNSDWLKRLTLKEVAALAEIFTVQQMLARRNFKERWTEGKEISLRELLYPLMQGYDSLKVKADVEIGGFDQLFNLQAGRAVQKYHHQSEQNILVTQMLEGLDGRKMSTSWGNVVTIVDPPKEMFGKIMRIHDDLIKKYFLLCTDLSEKTIEEIMATGPRDAKLRLAREIVALYHSALKAEGAQAEFIKIFADKKRPENMPTVVVNNQPISLVELLMKTGVITSKNEARRLISQGGVYIEDKRQADANKHLSLTDGAVLKIGARRFFRIAIQK
jgi:tyrosyl-tRNA synthetase